MNRRIRTCAASKLRKIGWTQREVSIGFMVQVRNLDNATTADEVLAIVEAWLCAWLASSELADRRTRECGYMHGE